MYTSNESSLELYSASEVFEANEEITSYYGLKVPYVVAKGNLLLSELSIAQHFDRNVFLEYFKSWCSENNMKSEYSFKQLKNIYSLLMSDKTFIQSHPVIFIPIDKAQNKEFMKGKFVYVNDVFCIEETGLFEKYESEISSLILQKYYSQVFGHHFPTVFVQLGVIMNPTLEMYTELIFNIQKAIQSDKISFEEAIKDLFCIFNYFMDLFKRSGDRDFGGFKNLIQKIFENKTIWPSIDKRWISLAESPLIVDDAELASNFIEKLNFLCLPEVAKYTKQTSDENPLFTEQINYELIRKNNVDLYFFIIEICNLKLVSSMIKPNVENITVNLRPAPIIQNLCRKVLPYIQCFLMYKYGCESVYKECKDTNIDELLLKMKFYSVKSLETIYYYIEEQEIQSVIKKKSFINKNKEGNLEYFVSLEILENEKEVLIGFLDCFITKEKWMKTELTKFIKQLYPFINNGLSASDKLEFEKDHEIRLDLDPNKEKKWIINEAVVQNYPSLIVNQIPETNTNDYKSSSSQPQVKYNLDQQNTRTEYKISDADIPRPLFQRDNAENSVEFDNKLPEGIKKSDLSEQSSNHSETHKKNNAEEIQNSNKKYTGNYNEKQTKPLDIELIKNSNLTKAEVYEETQVSNVNWSEKLKNFDYQSLKNNDDEDIKRIGKYGELWVYEMLKKKYENDISENIREVVWMNEAEEMGNAFDLKIIDKKQNIVEYIEVKSTGGTDKNYFPVSANELLFAQSNPATFFIYRLFNVKNGDPDKVECKIIKDVVDKMNKHAVGIFMVI